MPVAGRVPLSEHVPDIHVFYKLGVCMRRMLDRVLVYRNGLHKNNSVSLELPF
jgi:hypothetical protein